MSQLAWQEALPAPMQPLAKHLTLEVVRVSRDAQRLLVSFTSDKLVEEEDYLQLQRAMEKLFPGTHVALRVASPALQAHFRDHLQEYVPFLTACLVRQSPGIKPMLKHAKWTLADGRLQIEAESKATLQYLETGQVASRLERVIKDVFRLDIHVQLGEMADNTVQRERLEALRQQAETLAQAQIATTAKAKVEEKPSPKVLGYLIHDPAVAVSELREDSGKVTIAGEVLSVETRETKSGDMRMVFFGLTDYTGTIQCKAFLRYKRNGRRGGEGQAEDVSPPSAEDIARVEKIAEAIVAGTWLTVRGECTYDKYSRETVLMINDINLKEKPIRLDEAPRKRVELHAHTQMSAMDSVVAVEDLIARAAKWGHPAIAITDHGVVQAFPAAFGAAKKNGIKLIPGVEGYLVDGAGIVQGADARLLDTDYVVFDFETTGLHASTDRVIEIGAVRVHNGEVVDEYSQLVNPGMLLPAKIVEITGITDAMLRDAPPFAEVAATFAAFLGDAPVVAHNASFDVGFLRAEFKRCSIFWRQPIVDTLALARKLYPKLKNHKLGTVVKHLNVSLVNAHRAVHDARATALMFLRMLDALRQKGALALADVNHVFESGESEIANHIILLAENQTGMTNINRLVSASHLEYFHRKPHIPRELLTQYREGIIVGSACEAGELFRAMLSGADEAALMKIAKFYDYLEIQPIGNNEFLIRNGEVADEEGLRDLNRRIVKLGEKLNLPVVATGDVHFLDEKDATYRALLMAGMGFSDADEQPPLHFKTTQEMLDEFKYLGKKKAEEVVIDNPCAIADCVGPVSLFPKHPEGKETFQPFWPQAEGEIKEITWGTARSIYGDELPEIVRARLQKELDSVIGYGFGTLYSIAQKLVSQSLADGYLVGSRGSVGSSFAATMCGITEVNPLPPHYVCPNCKYSQFDEEHKLGTMGVDMPDADCPQCGTRMKKDGFDIPFEVFLGFKGDKVPDIDLNFSGVYQPRAQENVRQMFPGHVFRAGTIGTLMDKTAYGFVAKYLEERSMEATEAEKNRLVQGCVGVKRTTGQHPAGMVILPEGYEIYQFTAIQHPADDKESGTITTHYGFGSMHDVLVKIDALGHDDPTMIRVLEDLSGIKALDIPLTDPAVMSLFSRPDALGVAGERIRCTTGTYGIPEFGTKFVRSMLDETQPSTMEELVRISGLSHGESVWVGNAQDLVANGTATLKQCICTRDDIMNALMTYEVAPKMAFDTMESVRKGKGLRPDMEQAMLDAGVPAWFIDSCKKIKYMFPKAHAVAYVTMALRIAWFKVYRPEAYYAAYYTVRADGFDANLMLASADAIRRKLDEFEVNYKTLSEKEKDQITLGEIALEMNERGIHFVPIDLYLSDSEKFMIVDGGIRPPFTAIPGLGLTAAQSIVAVRTGAPFISQEEFKRRTRVSSAVMELLRLHGCLAGLPETSQVSLFG